MSPCSPRKAGWINQDKAHRIHTILDQFFYLKNVTLCKCTLSVGASVHLECTALQQTSLDPSLSHRLPSSRRRGEGGGGLWTRERDSQIHGALALNEHEFTLCAESLPFLPRFSCLPPVDSPPHQDHEIKAFLLSILTARQ